jgi:ribonuclease BN (tRNA processing enzyme)
MQLVVLGSGTSVPHASRCSPGYWIETLGGTILLDAGPDSAHRMAEENLDWPNLDAIWISHFHLDHVGGLPTLLFGYRWAPQTQQRTKPLRLFGPPGLRRLIDTIDKANDYKLFQQPYPVELNEVEHAFEFEILPRVQATVTKTPHTDESLALRLTDQSRKMLVFTSDTGFSEELITFAAGVDLLLIECSFRRNKPVPIHLELADAMKIASESKPKRVVLTHLYPEWDGANLVVEARALWPGETIESTDGLRITI